MIPNLPIRSTNCSELIAVTQSKMRLTILLTVLFGVILSLLGNVLVTEACGDVQNCRSHCRSKGYDFGYCNGHGCACNNYHRNQ
ncbi:hypothetical protein EB796_008480 [Bugula neritina]|uniref:Defensin n=1 Tax=Bugula neritina TaxID=10212 RepID=A0A7J7K6I7_BUGNE|nr:hypothetical protein EB796_008480 [Bugula neritina]